MEMLLPGWSYDERLQAWYQCTSLVVLSSLKFVPSAYVVHSQSCTPSCLSSILDAIEYQLWCCCPAGCKMNASKVEINVLRKWSGAHWNLFQVRMLYTTRTAHLLASPVYRYYGSYSICNCQWGCCCLATRTMNASKLRINALPGWCGAQWILFQGLTLYTARVALSPLYIWWCHLNRCNWIWMKMLLPSWSYNERPQAWYECTSWVVWSSMNFVPCAYVTHSQSCTPSCLSSILVL